MLSKFHALPLSVGKFYWAQSTLLSLYFLP